MLVIGRVFDRQRCPLVGARVTLLGWPKPAREDDSPPTVLAPVASADGEGRFRLRSDYPPEVLSWAVVLATCPGYGLSWHSVCLEARPKRVRLRLEPELPLHGRLVDLQGEPAAGVTLHVVELGKRLSGGNCEVFTCYATVEIDSDSPESEPEDLDPEPKNRTFALPFVPDRLRCEAAAPAPPLWPAPVTTDHDGRFVLGGVGNRLAVRLEVCDTRFAPQFVDARRVKKQRQDQVHGSLVPAHILEGCVRAADTGCVLAGARVNVEVWDCTLIGQREDRTDDSGRFRLVPYPGPSYYLTLAAPEGQPYLSRGEHFTWPADQLRHQVDLTLPRGVLVQGRVVEAPSGRPVADALIQFAALAPEGSPSPGRADVQASGQSGPDGIFQMVIPPRPGHLLIDAPSAEYSYRAITARQLSHGQSGGSTLYHHAVLSLRDVRPFDTPRQVTATLRRGVTLRGRLLGPDGEPVLRQPEFRAALFYGGHPLFRSTQLDHWPHLETSRIDERGRFALFGCNPARPYRLFFVGGGACSYHVLSSAYEDEQAGYGYHARLEVHRWPSLEDYPLPTEEKVKFVQGRWGAVVDVRPSQAGGEPVSIRLAKCATATVRLLDAQGQPVAGYQPGLQLLLTSPEGADRTHAEHDEEVVWIIRPRAREDVRQWPEPIRDPTQTGADGRITFYGLIPGATYRLWLNGPTPAAGTRTRDFHVAAGENLHLPDLIVAQ